MRQVPDKPVNINTIHLLSDYNSKNAIQIRHMLYVLDNYEVEKTMNMIKENQFDEEGLLWIVKNKINECIQNIYHVKNDNNITTNNQKAIKSSIEKATDSDIQLD